MPIYEYRCRGCGKRSSHLLLSATRPAPVSCPHCRSDQLERLLSRFASPKSEEARLETLADPSTLGNLDEHDPRSMARFMKKMGQEMGEDFGEDLDAALEDAGGESGPETAQTSTDID